MSWDKLSMTDRAKYIKLAVANGITDLNTIKDSYNSYDEGEKLSPYSAGRVVGDLYENFAEERLGDPLHNYDFNQSNEWADAHGYYPDERGHRDDAVKKPSHPTHPSKGKWNGLYEFQLTDKGMEDPNFIMFGMTDNNQDPQAVMTYNGTIVLPELTVTPKGNYIHNSYDNLNLNLRERNKVKKFAGGGNTNEPNINLPEITVTPRMNYISYTGNETNAPTKEQFIQSKIDEARAGAVQGMLSLKSPVVPVVPSKAGRFLMRAFPAFIDNEEAMFLAGKDPDPSTCIFTVTSQYGKNHSVSGNKTLAANPEKYGYTWTDTPQMGDIVQLWNKFSNIPHHAAMVTGFNKNGDIAISQSDGGTTSESLTFDDDTWESKWGKDVPKSRETIRYLTFIGSPEDRANWAELYNNYYNK